MQGEYNMEMILIIGMCLLSLSVIIFFSIEDDKYTWADRRSSDYDKEDDFDNTQ